MALQTDDEQRCVEFFIEMFAKDTDVPLDRKLHSFGECGSYHVSLDGGRLSLFSCLVEISKSHGPSTTDHPIADLFA